jgi:hypothetical protein
MRNGARAGPLTVVAIDTTLPPSSPRPRLVAMTMHLVDVLLAAAALSPLALWSHAARPASPAPIEVVFTDHASPRFCDGCHKTVTDSLAGSTTASWTCPNGDKWTLVLGTPVSADGLCAFALEVCHASGACTFVRSATLLYLDLPLNGTCPIYYRENGSTGEYSEGSAGERFDADLAASCVAGSPGDKVCDEASVDFYDSTLDTNTVVFSWSTKVCCNKCPD